LIVNMYLHTHELLGKVVEELHHHSSQHKIESC
jgi:hypothetical protein